MTTDSVSMEWLVEPLNPELTTNCVHLWRAALDCEPAVTSRLEETLAQGERDRANRFFSQIDRNHFIAARGILRELLGTYLNLAPSEIEFCYGDNGKPALNPQTRGPVVQFNLSHSGNLAVYAFSLRRRLGIDVELVRPQSAAEDIAARYFAQQEVTELRKLPPSMQVEGFFNCWTRKEAYVKARGAGLSIPLDSFTVSTKPDAPVELHAADSAEWSIHSFRPSRRHVGAVAVEGKSCLFRYLSWQPWSPS
jgi:4'-phosphopantetheinyl transferase